MAYKLVHGLSVLSSVPLLSFTVKALQQTLRRELPSPYIISHAPIAPWFTNGGAYAKGGYKKVHDAVGKTIDFYNVRSQHSPPQPTLAYNMNST